MPRQISRRAGETELLHAVLDGLQQEAITSGADLGEALDASEEIPTGFEGTEGSEEAHVEVNEVGQEQSAES